MREGVGRIGCPLVVAMDLQPSVMLLSTLWEMESRTNSTYSSLYPVGAATYS
jgi:hypothetical protein